MFGPLANITGSNWWIHVNVVTEELILVPLELQLGHQVMATCLVYLHCYVGNVMVHSYAASCSDHRRIRAEA